MSLTETLTGSGPVMISTEAAPTECIYIHEVSIKVWRYEQNYYNVRQHIMNFVIGNRQPTWPSIILSNDMDTHKFVLYIAKPIP